MLFFKIYPLSTHEKSLFWGHLALLIRSGLDLSNAIKLISITYPSKKLAYHLDHLYQDLLSGEPLTKIFKKIDPFSAPFIQLAQATGHLADICQELSKYHLHHYRKREQNLKNLRYPLWVLGIAIILCFWIFGQILPQFADFFHGLGKPVPHFLLKALNTKKWFIEIGYKMVFLFFGILKGLFFLNKKSFQVFWDRVSLKLYGLGAYYQKKNLAFICKILAFSERCGLSFSESLCLCIENLKNLSYKKNLMRVHYGINQGLKLSQAFAHSNLFPNFFLKWLVLAEETGNLEQMLQECALFFEESVHTIEQRFVQQLPILVTLFLGSILACILLCLYLPILELGSLV